MVSCGGRYRANTSWCTGKRCFVVPFWWFDGVVVIYCHRSGGVVWKECGNRWMLVSVDVGVGNLEEKLAPSSEKNLIIT